MSISLHHQSEEQLFQLLHHEETDIRLGVLEALTKGRYLLPESVVNAIEPLMYDETPEVRLEAASICYTQAERQRYLPESEPESEGDRDDHTAFSYWRLLPIAVVAMSLWPIGIALSKVIEPGPVFGAVLLVIALFMMSVVVVLENALAPMYSMAKEERSDQQ